MEQIHRIFMDVDATSARQLIERRTENTTQWVDGNDRPDGG